MSRPLPGGSLTDSYGAEAFHQDAAPMTAYYQQTENPAPEVVPSQKEGKGFYVAVANKEQADAAPEKKRILGIPAVAFYVIAAVGLVVVGLALGLGLGLGLGNSSSDGGNARGPGDVGSATTTTSIGHDSDNGSTSTSSSSSSSTSSAPVTSGTTGLADNSCTSNSPSTYYSSNGNLAFTKYCATDWPKGIEAFDGDGNVSDLFYDIVYTFEDCMDLCLDYNDALSDGDTLCNAVTYNSNLTRSVAGQGANCFLKDKRGVDFSATAETASGVRIE